MVGEATLRWGAEVVDATKPNLPGLKARFLLDHTPEDGHVMEIGCGDGKMLRTLKSHRPHLELYGCDVQEPQKTSDLYAFRAIESGTLPFDDASLDVVLIFDVLEHVPSPMSTLDEAVRVLKPNGRLVAFVPVEGERLSVYEVYRAIFGRDVYAITKEHIQAFTHDGLRTMIEDRFELTEIRYAYHALGQAMDATFFAALKMTWLRNFWWKDNVYYHKPKISQSLTSAAMNKLLELGNFAAWGESTLLRNTRFGAAGILVDARVRKGR